MGGNTCHHNVYIPLQKLNGKWPRNRKAAYIKSSERRAAEFILLLLPAFTAPLFTKMPYIRKAVLLPSYSFTTKIALVTHNYLY